MSVPLSFSIDGTESLPPAATEGATIRIAAWPFPPAPGT